MTELIIFIIAGLFFLGSLDDLIIDVVYIMFGLAPKKFSSEQWSKFLAMDEKPIAIMVPAWHEFDVLEAMVTTNLKRINYKNFQWFIGVYPNDEKTLSIALDLQKKYPQKIVVVVNDRPGPTTKAQMLNRILSVLEESVRIAAKEGRGVIPHYIGIHDAEDVIHPLAFKAINAQDADLDFIQIPIFSLPVSTKKWVTGTYLDEFADLHVREIPARQKLRMPIPSAGVGTFFSRSMLETLGRRFEYWFDENNLTEDYEISLRIARLGGKQLFLSMLDPRLEVIATREYFPDQFATSIRQKTRWTIGIGLQTMIKWGTFSSLQSNYSYKNIMAKYALWRDRKALWSNPLVLLSWTVLCFYLFKLWLTGDMFKEFLYPQLLVTLLNLNLTLFAFRLFQRARTTYKVYGMANSLMSVPRLILGSVINGFASIRAIYQYRFAKKSSTAAPALHWDKTQHEFPSELTLQKISGEVSENVYSN